MPNLPDRSPDALYIGDGVYADVERGMIRLTTEDGEQVTNTIYLEMDVVSSFLEWILKHDIKEKLR